MIQNFRVRAPELVQGSVGLRPVADDARTGTEAAGRAGARRSFEEGPSRASGSA